MKRGKHNIRHRDASLCERTTDQGRREFCASSAASSQFSSVGQLDAGVLGGERKPPPTTKWRGEVTCEKIRRAWRETEAEELVREKGSERVRIRASERNGRR